MKIKTILSYFWKLSLCGMAFIIGLALDGAILHVLGFLEPSISISEISTIIWLWFLPGSMMLAFILSFLAQKLQANWLVRWIVLFEIAWVFSIVGTGIASFIFISTRPILAIVSSLFILLTSLIPLLLLSATAAALFQTTERLYQVKNHLRYLYSSRFARTMVG